MKRLYNAADVLSIGSGDFSLQTKPQIFCDPLPPPSVKRAVLPELPALPERRQRNLTAADIFAISQHAQPWHSLKRDSQELGEAG